MLSFDRSMGFELHPQLRADTVMLGQLPLCSVLLMNNMLYPWVILVPNRPETSEITDLLPIERSALMDEISLISATMQNVYAPDKMNIAALGNMVPQLHVHIIARYKTDQSWPKPVWGGENKPYSELGLREVSDILQREFGKIIDFMRPS